MEQSITSTSSKAITIALILIVINLVGYFMDMGTNSAFAWVTYALFVIGIIASVNIYGKQINYNSRFGNYFTHGFKVTALVTAIMIIFMAIFIIAFPDVKDKAMEFQRNEMLKQGIISEEQIQQMQELSRKYFMVITVGATLLGYIFFGTLAALVGAGITKKQPNPNKGFDELR